MLFRSHGSHLVVCYPGGQSRRFNIDPNHAALIAAGRVAEDAMCDAIRKASEMRPPRAQMTQQQRDAWENLIIEFGDEARSLSTNSARDVAEAGLQALNAEANKLMSHPAVIDAYNQFILVCKLTNEQNASGS